MVWGISTYNICVEWSGFLEGWLRAVEGNLREADKGDWSRVDSRRILSNIILLSYVTAHLQENS